MPAHVSLGRLHLIIQAAMGWDEGATCTPRTSRITAPADPSSSDTR
ncbi:hypothetical protein ABZW18_00160 [Streptomyces sp. NPDC004647]